MVSLSDAAAFLRTVTYPGCDPHEQTEYIQAHLTRMLDLFRSIEKLQLTNTQTVLDIGAKPYLLAGLVRKYSAARFIGVGYSIEEVRDVQRSRITSGTTGPVEVKSAQIPLVSSSEELPIEMWQVNVETTPLPFPDNSMDVVVFSEILEHLIFNPSLVMAEINRVLKPNGTFILSTPNQLYWVRIAKMLLGRNIDDPYSIHGPYGRHNRNYTVKELLGFAQAHGFSCTEWTTRTFLPLSASPAQRAVVNAGHTLFTLLPSRKGKTFVGVFRKTVHTPEPQYPGWLYH